MSKGKYLPKTHVIIVMDQSGSMSACAEEARQFFNEHLDELKKQEKAKAGHFYITLVTFSSEVDPVTAPKPVKEVDSLQTYETRELTALYDAMATGINTGKAIKLGKNDAVLCIIITDGFENASKEFNQEAIKKLIDEAKQTGRWTFAFLGSEQQAIRDAQTIGTQTLSFSATPTGYVNATSKSIQSLRKYVTCRVGGQLSSANYFAGVDQTPTDDEEHN